MRLHRICALAPALLLPDRDAHAAGSVDLDITIRNVLPGQGELRVALFDRAEGFPDAPAPSMPTLRQAADAATVRVRLSGVPAGRWAVMVLQDLNGNGRIDSNLLGLPREPYGASNNRLPALAPPRFDEALVTLGPAGAHIQIDLRQP